MIACLRPISILCLAGLLAACASQPSSTLERAAAHAASQH